MPLEAASKFLTGSVVPIDFVTPSELSKLRCWRRQIASESVLIEGLLNRNEFQAAFPYLLIKTDGDTVLG